MKKVYFFISILVLVGLPWRFSHAQDIVSRVKGFILLQVQQRGEAWYVNPVDSARYYMKDGPTAYQMMRQFGLGITDVDLAKIPAVADTTEMKNATSVCASNLLAARLKGRILLQIQQHGEAWYVYPSKCRMIYMKDGAAAYAIMRFLGLGITDADLFKIVAGTIVLPPSSEPVPAETSPAPAPIPAPVPGSENAPIARIATLASATAEKLQIGLDGRASSDPNNDPLNFQWSIVGGPGGASLQNSSNSQPTLLFPKDARFVDTYAQPGEYLVQLIVNDGVNNSQPVQVSVKVNFYTIWEQKMLDTVNALRVSQGAGLVTLNEKLTAAARKYAHYMRLNNWFDHDDREGRTFAQRITAEGYIYQTVGENIGVVKSSQNDLVLDDAAVNFMFEGWRNSPTHYANMIETAFKEAGFAFSLGPVNDSQFPFQEYATQEFGTQR